MFPRLDEEATQINHRKRVGGIPFLRKTIFAAPLYPFHDVSALAGRHTRIKHG
jgi:hypothetical protein